MSKPPITFDTAEAALAEALAVQVLAWSAAAGDHAVCTRAVTDAVRALSLAAGDGHVCLPLDEAGAALLRTSGVVGTPLAPAGKPLLLDKQDRLYTHRAFDHEQALARRLVWAAEPVAEPPSAAALALQDTLFEPGSPQHAAATIALTRRLAVISGGPGTGKTTTARKLLALLRVALPGCRIALAAPTGKAAARLAQAVAEDGGGSIDASTVHRLLGARGSPLDGDHGFTHGSRRPLALDVLVVDEASMLDLTLARRLFDAVPHNARVLLLGDKDQLAAVEAGAVFAELARGGLTGTAVSFTHSHRFAPGSGIARLAAAFNTGDGAAVQQVLDTCDDDTVRAVDGPVSALLAGAVDGHAAYFAQIGRAPFDATAAHAAFNRFRILCALREGPLGVVAVNAHIARQARTTAARVDGPHWSGQPLMVLRNDPVLGLFNGDIGITLPTATGDGDNPLAVWFQRPDGTLRAVLPQRLPPHQTAFATTVHKAQGSEFDRVLVLPGTSMNRVLTRELLYTAVTRARQQVQLAGSAALLAQAAAASTVRHSGLADRLADAMADATRERTEAAAPPA